MRLPILTSNFENIGEIDLNFTCVFAIARFPVGPKYILHSQKHASCNKSVDILPQLVITSRYHNAHGFRFTWLAIACHNKSVASLQQACCKLIVITCQLFQQFVTSLQMTSCNKLDLVAT